MKIPFVKPKWQTPQWEAQNWAALNPEAARVWKNVQALHAMREEVAADAVRKLGIVGVTMGQADSITNQITELRSKMVPIGAEISAVEVLLRAAAASPQFKKAESEWAPMVAAAKAADECEEKLRLDRQVAEGALSQARAEAEKRATANVDRDPLVIAANKKLEALTAA